MKLLLLTLICIIFTLSVFSQGEGNNWYFGNYAGLSFSTDPPTLLNDGHLITNEGCAAVSSKDGVLVFYTDGSTVWDANHNIMTNGTGLLGNSSSTQSAVICPKPGTFNAALKRYDGYFIVTIDAFSGPNGVRFTEVDMTLNGGMGDVVSTNKNVHLFGSQTTEGVNISRHANGNDFWIIGKSFGDNNDIFAYHITNSGIHLTPIVSSTGPSTIFDGYAPGQIKVSPNNKLIAIGGKKINVYNFDNSSGLLIHRYSDDRLFQSSYAYSPEFSPNSNILYVSFPPKGIIQYDLTTTIESDFIASKFEVVLSSSPFGIKLAPNKKIYVSMGTLEDIEWLGAINNPDILGSGCNYVQNQFFLADINTFYNYPMSSRLSLTEYPFFGFPLFIESLNLCLNDITHFKLNDTTGLNNIDWFWTSVGSSLPPAPNSTDWEPMTQYVAPGEYAVLAVTYSSGTSDSIYDTISITTINNVNLGNDTTLCNGQTLTLDAGQGYDSYQWHNADADQTFTGDTSGQYIVEVGNIREDGSLCKTSDTINVLVGETPHARFSLVDSCEYDAVVYSDESTVTLPETITTWSWDIDNDGTEDYNTQNPTHLFTTGNYTTKLTVTSALGCTKDTVMPVVVFPKPTANFTFESKCLYDSLLFVDASTVLGDVIVGHAWNYGESPTPPVQSILPASYYTYSNEGTYTVSEIVSTANGCLDTITQAVEVFEVPTANYSTSNVCQDIAAEFTDQSTIASGTIDNWAWDFGNVSTGTNQNETHNYALDGTYPVQLIVISDHNCEDTLELDITIYPMPIADFTVADECLEESIPFTDNSTINTPGIISQWAWNFGDMSNPSSTQSPSHLYQTSGTYNINLTVTSDNNCANNLQQSVTVHPLPQVSFVASEICVNEPPTVFTNTSVITSGTNVAFGWSFGDANVSTSLQENPTFNYDLAGNYEVILGVLSDKGCTDTIIDTIKVKHKPLALFTQDTTGGCAPMCINFISESEDSIGIATWNWQFENNLGEGSNKYEGYCYNNAGTYDVKLIVQNTVGCYDTIESLGLINTFEYPIAEFELTPAETTIDNPTITFTNLSIDEVNWTWDFADEELDSTTYDPVHVYADTGNYIVELTTYSANGCSTKAYHEVIILPIENVFVPTAFSPNGDGENDVLYVRGYLKGLYFSVYDRWGKKVFETTNPTVGWEGLINGKPATEGVYMWYLQTSFNGEAKKFKGDVSLMR